MANRTDALVTNIVLLVMTTYETFHYLPAYKMIVDEANLVSQSSIHFDFASVWHPSMVSCQESNGNIVNLVSEYYYQNDLGHNVTISMSPRKFDPSFSYLCGCTVHQNDELEHWERSNDF